MQIQLYIASQEKNKRTFKFIKGIDISFIPNVNFCYFDHQSNIVYSLNMIYFSDQKISAIVSVLDESRSEDISKLFLK